MAKIIGLTGQRFGSLVVLRIAESKTPRGAQWIVLCDCGKQKVVEGRNLRNGRTKSCGHSTNKFRDLTGQRFGRLLVQSRAANSARGDSRWTVLCDCGVQTEVAGSHLRGGHTTSCGCTRKAAKSTHRQTKTTEYNTYLGAKARCTDFKPKAIIDMADAALLLALQTLNSFLPKLASGQATSILWIVLTITRVTSQAT